MSTWLDVADDHPFGIATLPYCVFEVDGSSRVGVGIGDDVLDLTTAARELMLPEAPLLAAGTLNPLLAAGPAAWTAVRGAITSWLSDDSYRSVIEPLLVPIADVNRRLAFDVADYVDFYSSENHATNVGRMFRPDGDALPVNWKHLPIGYHGRAGTVVVSGTPIVRPRGQRRTPDGDLVFGLSTRLDIEVELGFVVGVPSELGTPVALADFEQHVFGVCLLNDWSARDIQAWEYVPLGPFLGKSFATSVGEWVVPLQALKSARVAPPKRDVAVLPYLDDAAAEPWGLDIEFAVTLNGEVITRPLFAGMYWTAAQQLAHMTINGASLRTGDLYASGTVSGPQPDQRGSLLELCWGGAEPITLADGSVRTFLEDGDDVVISAVARTTDGRLLGLGEVRGRVVGARG
ncbi:MAG: fumarylacetoacetase [Actinomycetes bacterium]